MCLFAAFRCWENCYRLFWGDSILIHAHTNTRTDSLSSIILSEHRNSSIARFVFIFQLNYARGHFVVVMRCDAIVGLHSMVALFFAVFLLLLFLLFLVTLSVSDFIWQSDVIECVKNTLSSHLIDFYVINGSKMKQRVPPNQIKNTYKFFRISNFDAQQIGTKHTHTHCANRASGLNFP